MQYEQDMIDLNKDRISYKLLTGSVRVTLVHGVLVGARQAPFWVAQPADRKNNKKLKKITFN